LADVIFSNTIIEIVKSSTLVFALLLVVAPPLPSQTTTNDALQVVAGGIIRTDQLKKEIHLVFTGHEFADGGTIIRGVLKSQGIKASFFFTGDFYRNPRFSHLISTLKKEGHYLGAHSDKHLLYCSWEKRDSLLVDKETFQRDLLANYAEMKRFGVKRSDAPYFLPPFEWYNDSISTWSRELGLTLVNFTSGTYSNADWTHPELGTQYLSSDTIYARILRYEASRADGLNGFLLLTHIGTDARRKDKFYFLLDSLITNLKKRGYRFASLNESIN
jgi:endoglucanase